MLRHGIYSIGIFSLLLIASTSCTQNPAITHQELREHVSYLAADQLGGRKPGTEGGKKAAEYIRDRFQEYGLDLMADNGFQYFELVTDAKPGDNNMLKIDEEETVLQADFVPVSFSANKKLTTEVVFAGYGFDIDKDTLQWNDYKNIDAKGKWVMMFRGEPEPDNPHSPFASYAMLRSKVVTAEDHKAGGVLFVTPTKMKKEDRLHRISYDKTATRVDIPVLTITREMAGKILSGKDATIEELEQKLNTQRKPESFATGKEITARADVKLEKDTTQNVVALVKAASGSDDYVVIGAHYDHLGMGGSGSGSRVPDTSAVHNGADDNASGVAGVIELAGKLQQEKAGLKKNVIFVAFGAEEMGIIGAKHFMSNCPVPKENISAMINFDMIGRMDKDEKSLSVSGVGTAKEFDSLLKSSKGAAEFSLATSPDGYGPSDHAAFYAEDIPVLFMSTGAHDDYHTPADDADRLDYKAQEKVMQYAYRLTNNLAGTQQLTFQKSGSKDKTRRMRLKVTFGIIPDYSGKVKKGLGVDGVKDGGPADKGGMKKGDIIVAIEGKPVGDIYEYMHRLQDLESGQIVTVDVLRNGEKKVLILQL